jgi:hypothetical protein
MIYINFIHHFSRRLDMRFMSVTVLALFCAAGIFAQPSYIGADKCAKMCHKSKEKGEQYGIWKASKHAQAYATLGTPLALETAKKVGLTGDPQKSEKCLKCHVTAWGVDAARIDSTCTQSQGIGCEVCHGPGSAYAKLKIMKDKKAAIAAGLVEPTEKVCVKCHNTDSPQYKPFNFAEFSKKIAHPRPKTEAKPESDAKPAEAK